MEYQRAKRAIEQAKSIAVFAHTNPDGDTLGSSAALYLALKQMGKECGLFCDDPIPVKYKTIPCGSLFELEPSTEYDLAIAVDCAEAERLGRNSVEFFKFKNTINLDHHFTNSKYAAINITESTSSSAEIVLDFIETLGVEIDAEIADALFIGLSTDTGSFQHSNTTASSFAAAAQLLNCGANSAKIAFEMFKKSTLARTKLLGKVLSRIRTYFDGKVSLVYTLANDFKEFDLDKSATESFVDFAIAVEGAVVGIAFCQYAENVFKASLRSANGFDVSEVAAHFGGGGHKQAAGCMISGFFEDAVEKLLRQISFSLN